VEFPQTNAYINFVGESAAIEKQNKPFHKNMKATTGQTIKNTFCKGVT
jgi:hypothetical protein